MTMQNRQKSNAKKNSTDNLKKKLYVKGFFYSFYFLLLFVMIIDPDVLPGSRSLLSCLYFSVQFLDPEYDKDFLFPAKTLPGAV